MPFSLPLGAVLFACCSILAVAPLRRPRRLAVLSWLVSAVPSELPVLLLVIVVASSTPDALDGDWTGSGVAMVSAVALIVVAARGLQATPALARALDEGLGEPWRWRRRGRPSWWRMLLAPWPIRPREVERVADVSYGPDGVDNLVDVYRHRSRPTGAPTLLYFHGGRFRWGRKSREARPLLYRLARQGWTCVSANYHRSSTPGEGFPQHLVDVKRVIAWARADGVRFGIDPDVVVVAGSSAGAHLASMAALTIGQSRFQPGFEMSDTSIAAAICFYGYYGRLGGANDQISSPLDHVHGAAPPFLIVHGTNDTYTPIEGARALAGALRRTSSKPVALAELPGAQHSFDMIHSVRFEAVVDAVEAFTASLGIGPEPPRAAHRSPKLLAPLLQLVGVTATRGDDSEGAGTPPTSSSSSTTDHRSLAPISGEGTPCTSSRSPAAWGHSVAGSWPGPRPRAMPAGP